MTRINRALRFAVLSALWCFSAPQLARAQPVDPAARAAARDLGYEGVKAYQAGNFSVAVERLTRAYQVLRVPTLGLWLGRALAQQGRLVESSELLLDVTRLTVAGGDESLQLQAQKEAAQERVALLPRIAKLDVRVSGLGSDTAQVTIDNRELSSALLGVPSPTDPGKHVVTARNASGTEQQRELTLAEGATATIVLEFAAETTPSPTSLSPAVSTDPASNTPAPTAAKPLVPAWVGYTALAVGGVGLAAGGYFGLTAKSQRSTLQGSHDCVNDACSSSVQNDVNDYNRRLNLSTGGFALGALGVVSGVVVLWILPEQKKHENPIAIHLTATRVSQQLNLLGSF